VPFREACISPIFNIRGNGHRLVVAVAYVSGVVYVKFVGTHAEYDAINAQAVVHKADKQGKKSKAKKESKK
jgi:hypothetical protein